VPIIPDSGLLLATKVKPITSKKDDQPINASAGVVLKLYDAFELTIEVRGLTIMFSHGKDSTILCFPILLAVNSVVLNPVSITCRVQPHSLVRLSRQSK
jgi:hypothetical protein